MAWEWVGPTSAAIVGIGGIVFTWLSGAQGRVHAERVVRMNQDDQGQARILKEKRDAYVAALEYGELEAHRRRYEKKGRQDKVEKLEQTFPKGERVRISIRARAGLEASAARRCGTWWSPGAKQGALAMTTSWTITGSCGSRCGLN